MRNYERDDLFIQRMLQETYGAANGNDSARSSVDFFEYFKKAQLRAEDFQKHLESCSCDFFEIVFNEDNSCFRFSYNNSVFDIPVNWGSFHQCFISWQMERNDLVAFELHHDETSFAEVFNLLTPYTCDLLFCVSGQRLYGVLLPENKKDLRSDLEKKLGLTIEGPIQKAA